MSNPIPSSKKRNGFTGELEDKPEVLLAPSPADQRILAAPPHTAPLAESAERVVNSIGQDDAGVDLESHRGGSTKEDSLPGETPLPYVAQHDTPVDPGHDEPVQREDTPSANERVVTENKVTVINAGAEALKDDDLADGQDTSDDEHQLEMQEPEDEVSGEGDPEDGDVLVHTTSDETSTEASNEQA